MPATIQNETAVDNQNPLAAFDALGIDPKARFQFGKWKTFNVEWVRKVEPSYLRWLGDQDWFRADHHQRMTTDDRPKPQRGAARRQTKALPPAAASAGRPADDVHSPIRDDDQTESLPRAALAAFTAIGNVIRPAVWSR